ncbi:MAG TPA: S8 family serine peptidase [Candidatus Polarisedimenticolia bacterium]|nr:S8 family serine peptidase [Candidatus Polarisedimenticolia bacterium]
MRHLGLSVRAVVCLSGLIVAALSLASVGGPPASRAVLIEAAGPGSDLKPKLVARGIDVRETYDSAVLAVVTEPVARQLRSEQFEVTDLSDRDRTGRGEYVFRTSIGEPAVPASLKVDPTLRHDYDTYLVQFIGPLSPRWLEAIRDVGVETYDYLPDYSFIATVPHDRLNEVKRLPFVRWVGLYHPAYKISPALKSDEDFARPVVVLGLRGKSDERAAATLIAWGGQVTSSWKGETFRIDGFANPGAVQALARLPEVSWIDSIFAPAYMNDEATKVVQSGVSNPLGARTIHNKGLHGEGQIVTVCDSGVDATADALNGPGKILATLNPCNEMCPQPVSGCTPATGYHGTASAGIIAGDSLSVPDPLEGGEPVRYSYSKVDGHAYMAQIVSQNIGGGAPPPPSGPAGCRRYTPSYNTGARIHANGYGTGVADCLAPVGYCVDAMETDEWVWNKLHENPPGHMTITFPAGNGGAPNPPSLPSKITCEAQAKNVITVGSSKNGLSAHQMSSFSSQGPACDGRRKPTLVAPGEGICTADIPGGGSSCKGFSDYQTRSGTSFSHPAVAGNAALVRQYFTDGWYPSGVSHGSPAVDPSAALIKAVMINGATRLTDASGGTNYPNNVQGWGVLQMDNSLYFGLPVAEALKLVAIDEYPTWPGFTASNQERKYRVQITDTSKPFRSTLVWTDAPGAVGGAVNLKNDLNLTVRDHSCSEWKGNVFQNNQSSGGGSYDALNVEEGVLRLTPTAGIYSIDVKAANIVASAQPFALAVSGGLTASGAITVGPTSILARTDQPVFGTVTGSYLDTQVSDDIRETIVEVAQDGTRELEHVWLVHNGQPFGPVTDASGCLTINIEGARVGSPTETFEFLWSHDGTNWFVIPGAALTNLEPVGGIDYNFSTTTTFGVASLGASIYIKVRDTNRTAGDTFSNTIRIDRLQVRWR